MANSSPELDAAERRVNRLIRRSGAIHGPTAVERWVIALWHRPLFCGTNNWDAPPRPLTSEMIREVLAKTSWNGVIES